MNTNIANKDRPIGIDANMASQFEQTMLQGADSAKADARHKVCKLADNTEFFEKLRPKIWQSMKQDMHHIIQTIGDGANTSDLYRAGYTNETIQRFERSQ